MYFVKLFHFFLVFGTVFSEKDSMLKACAVEDIVCLKKSTELFMESTAAGVPNENPEFVIRPVDPLFIDMVCVQSTEDVMLHFKNVTITGLKSLKIEDFKMDTKAKSVWLSTKEDIDIVSDLVVELTDKSKTFTGKYTAKASAIGTARYNYELKKDDKDVEHFEVGPETITCEAVVEPAVTLSPELEEALLNDPDAKSKRDDYYARKSEHRKEAVCKIIEEAFVSIVHNIRAIAKVLPKTAFFTNV